MNNNNSDIFESNKKQNFDNNISGKNFFLSNPVSIEPAGNEQSGHLNDYDFNILKKDAYKDISDDVLKLEYKISCTEKEIEDLNNKIKTAKEINDTETLLKLKQRLDFVNEDYANLLAMYNSRGLSARIADTVSKSLNSKLNTIRNSFSEISDKLLPKLPKKLVKILEIKKALNTLENINKSVDELIALKIPYGEQFDKYKQLSGYIIKANEIHSQISGYMKK